MSRIPSLKYLTLLEVRKLTKRFEKYPQILNLPYNLLQILFRDHKLKTNYFEVIVDIDNEDGFKYFKVYFNRLKLASYNKEIRDNIIKTFYDPYSADFLILKLTKDDKVVITIDSGECHCGGNDFAIYLIYNSASISKNIKAIREDEDKIDLIDFNFQTKQKIIDGRPCDHGMCFLMNP